MNRRNEKKTRSASAVLEREFANSRRVTLAHAARRLGIDRTTLSRAVRRQTGRTWRELVHRIKERKAKRLLGDPHRTVKEIAFEVGFGSTSTFSRFFHNRAGVRPSRWRRKMSTKKE